jgi:hypothetical protein
MLIPCYDVVRVYIGRLRDKKNPFLPDKTHIHHKMLAAGMTQRITMVSIVSFSLVLSIALIFISNHIDINLLIVLSILIFCVINTILNKRISKIKKLSLNGLS